MLSVFQIINGFIAFILCAIFLWFFTFLGLAFLITLGLFILFSRIQHPENSRSLNKSRRPHQDKNTGPILEHDEFKQDE